MPAVLVAGAITLFALRTYEADMAFAQAEAAGPHELEEALGDETVDEVLEGIIDDVGDEIVDDLPSPSPRER